MDPSLVLSGLADCHLPGLYSLVLAERVSPGVGMRRIFYCGPKCNMSMWDGADFRLKPHNHRQDIRLIALGGDPQNVDIRLGYGKRRLWCYRFGSALLDGSFSLEPMYYDNSHTYIESIPRGGMALCWNEVHTVVAGPGDSWLVEEGQLAPSPGTERIWSVSDHLELSAAGLYNTMSREEIERIAKEIPYER